MSGFSDSFKVPRALANSWVKEIGEIQNTVRRVMPRQEDVSQKEVGSNPYLGKLFFIKSLAVELVHWTCGRCKI